MTLMQAFFSALAKHENIIKCTVTSIGIFGFAYFTSLSVLGIVTDYKMYFLKRVGSVPLKKMSATDQLSFWSFKLIHAFLFIALPTITWLALTLADWFL